jgi:hypothetical protein
MHTVCRTVLRTSSPQIRNQADSDGETGQVEIFDIHMQRYGTFVKRPL